MSKTRRIRSRRTGTMLAAADVAQIQREEATKQRRAAPAPKVGTPLLHALLARQEPSKGGDR